MQKQNRPSQKKNGFFPSLSKDKQLNHCSKTVTPNPEGSNSEKTESKRPRRSPLNRTGTKPGSVNGTGARACNKDPGGQKTGDGFYLPGTIGNHLPGALL